MRFCMRYVICLGMRNFVLMKKRCKALQQLYTRFSSHRLFFLLRRCLRQSTSVRKETTGMERIDRLYALLERDDIDEDTKATIRWAIFQLENAR